MAIPDFERMYHEAYEIPNISIPIRAVFIFDMMMKFKENKEAFTVYINDTIAEYEKEQKGLGAWKNAAIEDKLPYLYAIRDTVSCSMEDVPLHVNGVFAPIAKWRLENAC
jgi:hypothetical protein